MYNYRRIAIILVLLCVIGIGIILAFKTSTSVYTVITNQQVQLCQNTISVQFSSNQSKQVSCPTEIDSWIDVSLASTARNSTVGVNISLLTADSNGTVNNQTVYSSTGKTFSALIPLSVNGSTLTQITNLGGGNTSLKGYVNVYKVVQTNATVKSPIHPYRPEGLVVIFGGGVFLFLFGWDPRGIGTTLLTPRANPHRRPFGRLIKNVWFLRAISLIFGIIVSGCVLAYSLIFYYTFQTLGSTTSYFPWSWLVSYSDPVQVGFLFAIGLIIAIAPMAAFFTALFGWILPRLDLSLEQDEANFSFAADERREIS